MVNGFQNKFNTLWLAENEKYETKLAGLFERYGSFVTKHPVILLAVAIVVNCLLGIGLIRIEFESNMEILYTPMNSIASQDREKIKALYDDQSGENFHMKSVTDVPYYADIIFKTKDGSNILSTTNIAQMKTVHDDVLSSIKVKDGSGQEFTYENICAIRNSSCVIQGDLIFTSDFQAMTLANNITYPEFGGNLLIFVFGDKHVVNGILTTASSLRLVYYLRGNTDSSETLPHEWEEQFLDMMSSKSLSSLDIAYSVSDSLNAELGASTAGDIVFFVFTFTIMITYASLATSGGNCVSERQNLGRAGVCTTILAILGSFGIVSAIGVKFVNIVGVMPFLIIGIGIDDMFILMSGFSSAPVKANIEDKLRHTMRTSGVAITITSLTDFLAFVIGASSVFVSVRNFCVYTGVAVIFCYLNQLFIFLPCMVINERRMESNRHCGTCLVIPSRRDFPGNEKEARKCYFWCCTGDPSTKKEDNESPLEVYPKLLLKKIVLSIPFKIIILVVYAVYVGLSIFGVVHLEQGLVLRNLVRDDSYYHKYSTWFDNSFENSITVSFTIDSQYLYSSGNTQNLISNMLDESAQDPDVHPTLVLSWLSDYKASSFYQQTSENDFITGLQQFLVTRPDYRDDVVIDDSNTIIKSSRFYVVSKDLKSSTEQANFMKRMRDIADSSYLSCFAYAPPFIFYEQYLVILSNTLQTVGIAIAVMFLVTCVFMPHPLLVFLVFMTMVMILIGIFGFMHFWNLTLNSVTMIQLIMSIGFSVDFSAHICHAYISCDDEKRNDRVIGALDRSGGPIFNAFMSSFLGILMLLASSSYIFTSFFKLMFLVLTFGVLHSLLLLPVVLSKIGPIAKRHVAPRGVDDEGNRDITPTGVDNEVNSYIAPTGVDNEVNSYIAPTGVDNEVNSYIAPTGVDNEVNSYITPTGVDNEVNSYIAPTGVDNEVNSYIAPTGVDNEVNSYIAPTGVDNEGNDIHNQP